MHGHWRIEGASLASALVWTACVVIVPDLIGRAVNVGLLGHHQGELFALGGIIAAIGALGAVAAGLRRYCNGLASRSVERELRSLLFTRLIGFDVGYHDQVNRGQLLSRATSDLFQVQTLVSAGPAWIANSVTIVAVAIVLIVIDPLLGLVALCGLPIVGITSKRYAMTVRPALGKLQRARGNLAGVVEETVSGIRAVKGFGAEPVLVQRLGDQADEVRAQSLSIVDTRGHYNPMLNVIPMLELAAVNWLGGYLILHHELTVGTLLAFNAYLAVVTGPLQSIGWFIVQVQRALVSAQRLDAVTSYRPAIVDPEEPRELPAGRGSIRFDGVYFSYPGTSEPALRGLDLEITGGEVVALVGPTGSGKTTVASLIARLYDPQRGTVRLEGVDVRHLAAHELREAVGVVFEDSFLFDDTVASNLRVGRPSAPDRALSDAARLAQAHGFVSQLEHGYDAPVGERGLALSGGQRQRVALARGILATPRVIVLDDATSAVDAAKEREIISGLERVSDDRTMIIISHRAATVAMADRVVLLDRGQVAAVGTHDELMASSARYREVLGGDPASPDDDEAGHGVQPESSTGATDSMEDRTGADGETGGIEVRRCG
jgi:ATP-binding cassette subfamily B protein